MMVFGVCTFGVAALYLVPSVAESPSPVTMPRSADEPSLKPAGRDVRQVPQAGATGSGQSVTATLATTEPPQVAPADEPDPVEERIRPTARPTERARTAFDPDDAPDSEPPTAVPTIAPAKVTVDELTLTWPAATDNRRVIGYRIWLNGYEVATTAQTRATLRWFNDDAGQHVVQIKAIDAAGNQSDSWSTLLVTRPAPEPTETPRPTITPTPTPTPAPTPTTTPEPTEPTQSASVRPDREPTAPTIRKPAIRKPKPTPEPTATVQ